MDHLWDFRSCLDEDGSVCVVQIRANDPRDVATESVVVVFKSAGRSLADLESLTPRLRSECGGWGNGYLEDLRKTDGGIGASGPETLALILGVVGAVPTVKMILGLLKVQRPPLCPDRDVAWHTATWAVALQYETVERQRLRLGSVKKTPDFYEFEMLLENSSDQFTVQVHGDPKGEAIATDVKWVNRHAYDRAPGE